MLYNSDGQPVNFMVYKKCNFLISLLLHFTSIYHTFKTNISIGKICNMKIT